MQNATNSGNGVVFSLKLQLGLLSGLLLLASYIFDATNNLSRVAYVVFFAVLIYLLYVRSGLNAADIGLSRARIKPGLKWGFAAMVVVGVVVVAGATVLPDSFRDTRYNQSVADSLVRAFVFIPFATVFFEELVFRGYLVALLNKSFRLRTAIIISSLGFGLWHVFSSMNFNAGHFGVDNPLVSVLESVGVVLVTACAGVGFCWLRYKSGSIVAPMMAHWSINSFALIATATLWSM